MSIQIRLLDDIDGSDADEIVYFGLNGEYYEIDLSKANATLLREVLAPFVAAARPLPAPTKQVKAWRHCRAASMHQGGGSGVERFLTAVLGGPPAPELVARYENPKELMQALDSMGEQGARIIKMRFGLFGEQALTLKQVAERLGIGREAVRHIEARAMAVFRHHGLRQAQSSDDATDLIESLGFSERLLNCLKRAQIDRVAKLLTKTEDDLLAITGFGYNALEEVVAKLQDRGLTLRAGGSASPEQKVLSAMRTLGQGGMMAEVAARADLTIPEVVQALNALLKSKSIPRVGSVEVVFGQELTWELVT